MVGLIRTEMVSDKLAYIVDTSTEKLLSWKNTRTDGLEGMGWKNLMLVNCTAETHSIPGLRKPRLRNG